MHFDSNRAYASIFTTDIESMEDPSFSELTCFRLQKASASREYLTSSFFSIEQTEVIVNDLIGYSNNKCFFGNPDHDINNGDFTSGLYITNLLYSKKEPNLSAQTLRIIATYMKNQESIVPQTFHSDRCPFWSSAWSYLFGQPNLPEEDLLVHIEWVLEVIEKTKWSEDILDYYKSQEFAEHTLGAFITLPPIPSDSLFLLTGHESQLVRVAASRNRNCPEKGQVLAFLLNG